MQGLELYAPREPRHRRTWSVAAVVLAIVFIVVGQVIGVLPGMLLGYITPTGQSVGWMGTVFMLLSFAAIAALVVLWVLFFERRSLTAIGFNGSGLRRFLRGYAVGLAFLIAVVGGIALLGGYRVDGGGVFTGAALAGAVVPILALMIGFIVQGSTEEIVTRGWLMQVIASRHGLGIAVAVSSLLFGLLHILNTEPSPQLFMGVLNVTLYGVAMGLYAAREGSLWGVCGWHAAWNWLLGVGFGLEVSGQPIEVTPLVIDLGYRVEIPWWITGADFGPEGGVVTSAALILFSAWLFWTGRRYGYGIEAEKPL